MLETKGLLTVEDLLSYAPFRYEDRTNVKTIAQLAPGEMATVIAEVKSAQLSGFRRRNLGLFEAVFVDSSRDRLLTKWFHGGYLVDKFTPGLRVALYGKIELDSYTGALLMMHPEFEILTGDEGETDAALHTGRIVPIYEAAAKVTTRVFRSLVHRILGSLEPLEDHLPEALRERMKLPGRWAAIQSLALSRARHRPSAAQCFSHAGAMAADLRRVLLARMRPVVEARQRKGTAWNCIRVERSSSRANQNHAAVQTYRRAKAGAKRNR